MSEISVLSTNRGHLAPPRPSTEKMTKNKIVDVLVENKIKNQNKFFGRTEYMTAVIFDGEENIEGKIVPVLITHYNQNNLFGEIKLNKNIKAA